MRLLRPCNPMIPDPVARIKGFAANGRKQRVNG
jgi:hypothetical protein